MKNQSFVKRLSFALAGIGHVLRTEHSFRVHLIAVALVLLGLIVVRPAPVWWALMILASSAVIAAELVNTALEHLADHLHPEMHPAIRIVKDCAAAAVLVSAAGAVLAGVAFLAHVLQLWRNG
jgi:undecaprenol kinase